MQNGVTILNFITNFKNLIFNVKEIFSEMDLSCGLTTSLEKDYRHDGRALGEELRRGGFPCSSPHVFAHSGK